MDAILGLVVTGAIYLGLFILGAGAFCLVMFIIHIVLKFLEYMEG